MLEIHKFLILINIQLLVIYITVKIKSNLLLISVLCEWFLMVLTLEVHATTLLYSNFYLVIESKPTNEK